MRRVLLRAFLMLLATAAIGATLWVGIRALRDSSRAGPADIAEAPDPNRSVPDDAETSTRPPITGTVLGADGRPRPGVRVEIDGQRTETGDAGRFRFDAPPPGPVNVAVWDAGHAIETRSMQPGESVTVRLRPIVPIAGTVRLPGDIAADSARITVRDRGGTEVHLTTDAEGRFRVNHLPGGVYTVMISPHVAPDGSAWQRTSVRIDSRGPSGEEIQLTPARGAVIRGLVRQPDGAPCVGAACLAKGRAHGSTVVRGGGTTDAEGRFTIVVPPALECTVIVDTPDDETGWRYQRWSRMKVVGDGDELVAELIPGTMISGHVEAPRGLRVAGRTIGAYRQVGRDRRHICTGRVQADGGFTLRGLWDEAYYELRVEDVGGKDDAYVLSTGYRVPSGTTDVRLRLVRPVTFGGVLHDASGAPWPSWGIIVHHTTAGWSGGGGTDDEGRFSIDRVPPGRLRVIVLKPGRNAGSWELGEFRAEDRGAILRVGGIPETD